MWVFCWASLDHQLEVVSFRAECVFASFVAEFLAGVLEIPAKKRKRSSKKMKVCLAYCVLERSSFHCFKCASLFFLAQTDDATPLRDCSQSRKAAFLADATPQYDCSQSRKTATQKCTLRAPRSGQCQRFGAVKKKAQSNLPTNRPISVRIFLRVTHNWVPHRDASLRVSAQHINPQPDCKLYASVGHSTSVPTSPCM